MQQKEFKLAGAHERQLLALVRAGWHWSECTGANACVWQQRARGTKLACSSEQCEMKKQGSGARLLGLRPELAGPHPKKVRETSFGKEEDAACQSKWWQCLLAQDGSLGSKRCHGTREQRLQMASNEVLQRQKPCDLRLLS